MEIRIENIFDEKLLQKQLLLRPKLSNLDTPLTSSQTSPTTAELLSHHFELDQERNAIIHGTEEDESTDEEKMDEIFRTTETKYDPINMFRLDGKIRPIMICMKKSVIKKNLCVSYGC